MLDATELGDLLPLTGTEYTVGAESVDQSGEPHAQPHRPMAHCVQSITYVFAMEHPFFAVSDAKGRFRIEGLPPGEYELTAWHEELGEQQATITVNDDGAAQAGFTFRPRKQ